MFLFFFSSWRLMLSTRPVSPAATHSPATPPAPPTVMRNGTTRAHVQESGATWSWTATSRAPPRTAASMPRPSLPRKAAPPPPLGLSGSKTKCHGRKMQPAGRGSRALRLQHWTPTLPSASLTSNLVLKMAPSASTTPPPIPGVLLFC